MEKWLSTFFAYLQRIETSESENGRLLLCYFDFDLSPKLQPQQKKFEMKNYELVSWTHCAKPATVCLDVAVENNGLSGRWIGEQMVSRCYSTARWIVYHIRQSNYHPLCIVGGQSVSSLRETPTKSNQYSSDRTNTDRKDHLECSLGRRLRGSSSHLQRSRAQHLHAHPRCESKSEREQDDVPIACECEETIKPW